MAFQNRVGIEELIFNLLKKKYLFAPKKAFHTKIGLRAHKKIVKGNS